VSDDPIIIDAQRPAKLSGPSVANRLFAKAVVALPDIGRISIIGITEFGNPNCSKCVPTAELIRSNAPLAANIFVAHIRITRLGRILIDVTNPSLLPLRNSSNKSMRENRIIAPASEIMAGIEYVPIMFIEDLCLLADFR
jgi:hypothetical protein